VATSPVPYDFLTSAVAGLADVNDARTRAAIASHASGGGMGIKGRKRAAAEAAKAEATTPTPSPSPTTSASEKKILTLEANYNKKRRMANGNTDSKSSSSSSKRGGGDKSDDDGSTSDESIDVDIEIVDPPKVQVKSLNSSFTNLYKTPTKTSSSSSIDGSATPTNTSAAKSKLERKTAAANKAAKSRDVRVNRKKVNKQSNNDSAEDAALGEMNDSAAAGAGSGTTWQPQVTPTTGKLDDMGGIESIRSEIHELIEWPMRWPQLYRHYGCAPTRGILLHGPPGCGKTMLAHYIAGELEVPLYKVSAPEIVSGMSGESEGKIRTLFATAIVS
jgi:ribosome biogenesis ATPase